MIVTIILHSLGYDLPLAVNSARILLYADPGSGALALQLLLAAFFGALFYVRSHLVKLKDIFAGRMRRGAGSAARETIRPARER